MPPLALPTILEEHNRLARFLGANGHPEAGLAVLGVTRLTPVLAQQIAAEVASELRQLGWGGLTHDRLPLANYLRSLYYELGEVARGTVADLDVPFAARHAALAA